MRIGRRVACMTTMRCVMQLPLERLLGYWFGELAEADADELEIHLFDCPACHASLDELAAIADGVRALTCKGTLRTIVTDVFVARLGRAGLKLREYSVPAFGSVNCSVGPDDEVVVARLEADMREAGRVDALLYDIEGEGVERIEDVPLGAARDALVFTPRTDALRSLPDSTARVRLLAVDAHGEHVLGDYTFHHTATPS
jgi:hypothetical protein